MLYSEQDLWVCTCKHFKHIHLPACVYPGCTCVAFEYKREATPDELKVYKSKISAK